MITMLWLFDTERTHNILFSVSYNFSQNIYHYYYYNFNYNRPKIRETEMKIIEENIFIHQYKKRIAIGHTKFRRKIRFK